MNNQLKKINKGAAVNCRYELIIYLEVLRKIMKISGDDGLTGQDYKLTPSDGKTEISIWPTYWVKI